jgi:hypothetical protein
VAQDERQTQPGTQPLPRDRRGTVDAISVLYVVGGIPAIVAFLWLLFAVGVRYCGLPA